MTHCSTFPASEPARDFENVTKVWIILNFHVYSYTAVKFMLKYNCNKQSLFMSPKQ